MKFRATSLMARLAALGLVACCAGLPAHAESLLSQTTMISGQQSFVYSLQVSTAGTASITLSDLKWQGRLQNLSFALAGPDGLMSQVVDPSPFGISAAGDGGSTLQYTLSAPGTYYAYVSGLGTGRYGMGLLAMDIAFESEVAAVPLPASFWLLASGAAGLLLLQRRRAAQENRHLRHLV